MTSTNCLVIIQARMGSKRYPGKSLAKLCGRESLGHLIDGLLTVADRSELIVATSREKADDAIEQFCSKEQLNCFRGEEENVASRFQQILQQKQPLYFARISGDSPLFDPRTLTAAQALALSELPDGVSTALVDPFPSGMNVEVIKAATFLSAYPSFSTNDHFEHVTRYFYENKQKFTLLPLRCSVPNAQQFKISFDDEQDRKRLERFFQKLDGPHYLLSLEEKIRLSSE